MKCWNCDMELEEGSLFCQNCGKNQMVSQQQQSVTDQESILFGTEQNEKCCPFCGAALEEETRFCTTCGKLLPENTEEKKQYQEKSDVQEQVHKEKSKGKKGIGMGAALVLAVLLAAGLLKVIGVQKSESSESANVNGNRVGRIQKEDSSSGDEENGNKEAYDEAEETGKQRKISYDGAVDAVNTELVTFGGTIAEDGFLVLPEKIDVCARDEEGTPMRMNEVYYLQMAGDFRVLSEVGTQLNVTGTLSFSDNMPVLVVHDVEILKEAADENAIHRYEVFVEDCTWQEACEKCIEKGGYLARINSRDEFEYITKEIRKTKNYDKKQYYVGMRRDIGSDEYYLVDENNQLTGERMDQGYTTWAAPLWLDGEPSYRDSTLKLEETVVTMFKYRETGKWVINDVPAELVRQMPSYEGKVGYICEYNE